MVDAANDTVADELAAKIAKSNIGTAKCGSYLTAELSNGKRYWVTDHDLIEAGNNIQRKRRQALISQLREPSEAMVEKVARSLCKNDSIAYDPDEIDCTEEPLWLGYVGQAKAALSAAADALDGGV